MTAQWPGVDFTCSTRHGLGIAGVMVFTHGNDG